MGESGLMTKSSGPPWMGFGNGEFGCGDEEGGTLSMSSFNI